METAISIKKQPNRLLRGLILISVGIHFLIFMHISGIYNSEALKYIELTLEDITKPVTRSIPRPTHRPKIPDQPREVKRLQVKTRQIRSIKPIKVDPVTENFADGLMENVHAPPVDSETMDMGDTYNISELINTKGGFETPKSYLEMVMLKIESSKHYPESAKSMQKEGRVTIGFTITLQGKAKDVRIVRGCRHNILNQAALKAVQDASPFPRPPLRFFNKDIPLQLNVIFETT